jgi:protoporphyrin/coproporphyrin ferrochelatase
MDAVLLVSFGGPEAIDEVMPFLRRVTAGRNVPEERLLTVAEHYFERGGVSPINDQNRRLLASLRAAMPDTAVYWGNRNSAPWLSDAFTEMAADGVTRVVAVFTSAYSSYSGCRQYRENLAEANTMGLPVVKIPNYYNLPGFVDANYEYLSATLAGRDPSTHVLFTTHSIPVVMQGSSGPGGGQYVAQHTALAAHLMDRIAAGSGVRYRWELVFQSRSGPPQVPWLEPDINDRLAQLAADGVTSVVVAPIGFVSDHMEVVQDLDKEAAGTCDELGLDFARVSTVGDHPRFVAGLVESINAVRQGHTAPVAFDQSLPTPCVAGCCPNARVSKPALCEQS